MLGDTTIASATYLGIWFVDVTAVRALFVRVTDGFDTEAPSLQVVVVALIPEEFSVVQSAGRGRSGELTVRQGSLGFDEIGTAYIYGRGTIYPCRDD